MSWVLVPLGRKDFGYFDRQRDLFSDWLHMFDDSWKDMELEDSIRRFDSELDRVRDEMHRLDVQPIELDVRQPFIVDPEGNHKFSLRFNCSQFKPEEIEVKTLDKKLKVHAKHVHEDEDRKITQEFTREYSLPDNVDPNKLKSHLSEDGVLQIEAPVPPPPEKKVPKEIMIPIEHLESKKKPEKPKGEKEEPKEATEEPKETKDEPKETAEEPKETAEEPKETKEEPKETIEEPKETTEEPKEAKEEAK